MPRGRSRTPRGPGVLRGAGPGCLRGRSCAPRGRFCGGELVLGASGDRVALGGGNPASPGPVLLGGGGGGPGCLRRSGCTVGGRSCTPRGQSQCRAWAGRMQDALGILVELPRGCLGWQSWQLQDPRVWLQKVGAGTAWLSPGVPSCLPGRGRALPCPRSRCSLCATGRFAEHHFRPSFSTALGLGAGRAPRPGWPQQRGESTHSCSLPARRAGSPALDGGPRP